MCKVGGFGMPFWGFGFEERPDPIGLWSWQRLETLRRGFDRSVGATAGMMESNYPLDSVLWLRATLEALKYIVRGASSEEKGGALHKKTAARFNRINLPPYEHSHQSCRHSNLSCATTCVRAGDAHSASSKIIKRPVRRRCALECSMHLHSIAGQLP